MWAPAPNFTPPADRFHLVAAVMTGARRLRVRLQWRLAVQLVLHYSANHLKYNRAETEALDEGVDDRFLK
jgi:hypothetical protein